MRINEIFYSLQGEGRFTGTPAVFVRLSGCNLQCGFCDTLHDNYTEMSVEEIVEQVLAFPARHVVLTGGEPVLQVNSELTKRLHEVGCFIQMETNGTLPLPDDVQIDWITCSPKLSMIHLAYVDEIKVLYEGAVSVERLQQFAAVPCKEYRLQPCDVKDEVANAQILQGAIDYCLRHPQWKLSLQTHKLINIQ